ncbi:ATP-binding cassette domain-containing protein [Candidatus Coxiella mudrowiae]|uniref:ATP-binding cassette domain-containing protein n=1 Tax=Candidatus Coxiella mudrowiae TaxID=2054173 RepID=UPI0012FEA6A1|nr:ATP-binding cassette domain-containing protein [Candidatus Coxiella mudrowiae]
MLLTLPISAGKKRNVKRYYAVTIPKNTFLGIVGPSGAVKSTLLGIILGLLPVKSASIYCDDVDITPSIAIWIYHICCDMYLNILTL